MPGELKILQDRGHAHGPIREADEEDVRPIDLGR